CRWRVVAALGWQLRRGQCRIAQVGAADDQMAARPEQRQSEGLKVTGRRPRGRRPDLLLAQRLEDRPLDETRCEVHLVRVQTHRTRDGPDLCSGLFHRCLDVLALEEVLDDLGAVRDGRHTTEGDASVLPVATRDREDGGDRYEREVVDLTV